MTIGYSSPTVGWTEIGQEIQSLSNLCQNSVKCLSNGPPHTRSVQYLSNVCQVCIHAQAVGQRLDAKIQCLSKYFPINDSTNHSFDIRQSLDKHWMWTICGQNLLFVARGPLPTSCQLQHFPDKHWTWTNSGKI